MIALFDLNNSFEFDPKIDRWWSTKSPELSSLARTWFEVMKMCGPDVNESLHNGYPAAPSLTLTRLGHISMSDFITVPFFQIHRGFSSARVNECAMSRSPSITKLIPER